LDWSGAGDVEHGPSDGVEMELCDAGDHEVVSHHLKVGRRDRIAEHIMRPSHRRGGGHRQIARKQAKSRLSRGAASTGADQVSRAAGSDSLTCARS
jgi:hypothetical protein